MPLAAGTRFGPYEIFAPIGAGGMGEVYRARDTKLGRDVALKVLPEAVAVDPERMARFEREAQVLASLNHPNIATVYGFEAGAIGMELVEGPTLAERIGGRPMRAGENPSGTAHSVTHTTVGAIDRSELNGNAATADDLRALALTNYGHFTSMQVEDGGVRGLDLHLARLDASTRALFGRPLDGDVVRGYLRNALRGFGDAASLRVNVFSRQLHRDRMAEPAEPDVVVSVGAPRRIETTPVRLKSFRYERVLPHVKHVGTFGLFHHRRLAQLDGFDDALFVDASGRVSEASIWKEQVYLSARNVGARLTRGFACADTESPPKTVPFMHSGFLHQ